MSTSAYAEPGAGHAHPYNMSRKNVSVAWRAFVKLGGNKVICRICNKQMNYQSGSSTSNMVKHLQAVHKHILADVKPATANNSIICSSNNNSTTNNASSNNNNSSSMTCAKASDDLSSNSLSSEPWAVLQSAPAHLRQRWQDLKLGLQKEMEQHQQAIAWSVIGAPCLGAPAGADLATDSDASPTCWSAQSANNSNSNDNSNNVSASSDPSPSDSKWRCQENQQPSEASSYRYHVKVEPVESEDTAEQSERPDTASPPPLALSPPPPSPSPIIISASTPGAGSEPPPSDDDDDPPPPRNKKHRASQTNLPLPTSPLLIEPVEVELRLNSLRRAQERAEELHHEQLRESRARADAAQAEREHRLQLIRHAEEIHQQTLEAQRQALEHSRQLHELTMRQAHGKSSG